MLLALLEEMDYDYIGHFYGYFAVACKNGKYFHITSDGEPAYEQRYDFVGPFISGVAVACKNGRCFHIYPNGEPIYKERYDLVGPFKSPSLVNYAEAWKDGKYFHLIWKDGKIVEEKQHA
jgi:hypothetical protein